MLRSGTALYQTTRIELYKETCETSVYVFFHPVLWLDIGVETGSEANLLTCRDTGVQAGLCS
jgi:hypothetical protein